MTEQTGVDARERWTQLLDDMERGLAFVTDELASTGSVVPSLAFEPPDDLPPLPRSLQPRASFLLERTRRVEALVAERTEEIGRRIVALDRQQAESQPVRPAFFDRAI